MTPNSSTRTAPEPARDTEARKPPLPKVVFKVVNPALTAILRSRFHGKVSHVLMLLTFTGRKSGKRYTTPVGYHERGDALHVFTDSPWWKNLRGGAPVTIRLKGQDLPAWAEPTQDPDAVMQSVQQFLREHGVRNIRRLGIMLDPSREPTPDELRAALRGRVLIRITPGVTGNQDAAHAGDR